MPVSEETVELNAAGGPDPLRVVVLAGGVGGARFVLGLRHLLTEPVSAGQAQISVVSNVGDDMWLCGLRICPDLDSMMYALAGVNDEARGWGRSDEGGRAAEELHGYGLGLPWFTLGDRDLGTHVARTHLLGRGLALSEATERLCARWQLGVRLLPATDDEVETLVEVESSASGPGQVMHFERWWVQHRAQLPVRRFLSSNSSGGAPAPGVLEAIRAADVVLLAPSNPIVSVGPILNVGGVRESLTRTDAPVVGISPVIGGRVVRGMADVCLRAVGIGVDADSVALHYGARRSSAAGHDGGLLDGWLVAEEDHHLVGQLEEAGIAAAAVPLWMHSPRESAEMARAALELAGITIGR